MLKSIVAKNNLTKQFEMVSAATSTEEIWNGVGNSGYTSVKPELVKCGLSCEGKRVVKLKPSNCDYYGYIIGMDTKNVLVWKE